VDQIVVTNVQEKKVVRQDTSDEYVHDILFSIASPSHIGDDQTPIL
jgi:hypothetical protein